MTLPDVADLLQPNGLYADPDKLTSLARFLQNANSGGVASSLVVKSTSALLFGLTVSSTANQFIHVFDLASLPANATVPTLSFDVTALTSRGVSWLSPRGFRNGIVVANSSTQHALTIGTATCIFDVQFL